MSARKVPEPIRVAAYAYERSVMVVCENPSCRHTIEATIRSATEISDEACDRQLDRDLRHEGWRVDQRGETCPNCVKAGR